MAGCLKGSRHETVPWESRRMLAIPDSYRKHRLRLKDLDLIRSTRSLRRAENKGSNGCCGRIARRSHAGSGKSLPYSSEFPRPRRQENLLLQAGVVDRWNGEHDALLIYARRQEPTVPQLHGRLGGSTEPLGCQQASTREWIREFEGMLTCDQVHPFGVSSAPPTPTPLGADWRSIDHGFPAYRLSDWGQPKPITHKPELD